MSGSHDGDPDLLSEVAEVGDERRGEADEVFEKEDCDKVTGASRRVDSEVLVNMQKDIRPPPVEPGEEETSDALRSPRMKGKPAKLKDQIPRYGPMPNFEREIQKILAEQVLLAILRYN